MKTLNELIEIATDLTAGMEDQDLDAPLVPEASSDVCLTPKWIVDGLQYWSGGDLIDPFAEPDNTLSAPYYRTASCGHDELLSQSGESVQLRDVKKITGVDHFFVFMNPPYSRGKKRLAVDYLNTILKTDIGRVDWAILLPTDTATTVHRDIAKHATHMGFFNERLKFDISRGIPGAKPTTARFSNMIYSNFYYGVDGIRCYQVG